MKLIEQFKKECELWYQYRNDRHCAEARQKVSRELTKRYGFRVIRHAQKIKKILDKAEEEAKKRGQLKRDLREGRKGVYIYER